MRLLERWLGTELFVRRSNGVALTAAGRGYAETVGAILRDLRAATDRVREPPRDRAIVISTLPIFSERWLHRRIPSFRKAFDRAELRIETHNGEHDADREDVDAWILYSKGRHPGYSITRLFGEEVFPVCSPQFRETLSERPSAEEVIRQPLLHDIYWDTDWPDWAHAVGARAGELVANMRFALYKGVIQAAVDGMGMAVGHGEMLAKELASGKLVPLAHPRLLTRPARVGKEHAREQSGHALTGPSRKALPAWHRGRTDREQIQRAVRRNRPAVVSLHRALLVGNQQSVAGGCSVSSAPPATAPSSARKARNALRLATGSSARRISRHHPASSIQTGGSCERSGGSPSTAVQRAIAPVECRMTRWTRTVFPAQGCHA